LNQSSIKVATIAWALLSGILFTVSFPETGLSYAAWIAVVPLLAALNGLSRFDAFRIGFWTGMVHYTTLLYWFVPFLKTYGPFPIYLSVAILLLLSAYLALYTAFFAMLLVWLCTSIRSLLLFAPLIWVFLEYGRSVLFGGFPWELLGYSQYRQLHLIQIADILSVYGLSYIIVLANTTLFIGALYLRSKKWCGRIVSGRRLLVATLATACVFVLVITYGFWRIHGTDQRIAGAPKKRIAVVQGNIDQTLKWNVAHQLKTIDTYLKLSASQQKTAPQLIVWPETAMPFYLFQQKALTEMVINGIRSTGTDYLISSPAVTQTEDGNRYFNRAFLVQADGTLQDTYDKAHLVPFGEYVPFKKWLPFLGKMVAQVGDFSSGPVGDTLDWRQHQIGTLICYELIFPYLSRAAVRNGADMLINITNDAWYGKTSAPYQHFSMAVFRAVETRRTLIRSANTGISGFIDPVGRILSTTSIFKALALTKSVPLLTMRSPYVLLGDIFARACCILVIAFIIRRFQAGRQGQR
jgi:apolipoprotein N-acyltransferase